MCRCGVVTVTLQYLGVRFEPEAFGSLVQLLAHAQARLDRGLGRAARPTPMTRTSAYCRCATPPDRYHCKPPGGRSHV